MLKSSPLLVLLLTIFICGVFGSYNALALDATIYYENGIYKIKNGIYDLRSGVAAAHYDDSYEVKGWDVLSIETNGLIKDELQSYAAGYLEGVLTRKRIYNHFVNLHTYVWADSPDKKMPQYVRDFLESQRAWVRDSAAKYANDPFWQQVRTVYLQMEGLVEGYNYATTNNSEKISYAELQVMSSSGDLFDIVNVKKDFRPNFNRMNSDQILQFARDNGHCSAIFKVAPDFSNIYFAHTSWFVFAAMTRIFKTYTFNFNNKLVASPKVSFSGYPATLASNDDFYITQSGLVVIETSNNIFNTSLYDLLTPKSLLCWQRVILANRLADVIGHNYLPKKPCNKIRLPDLNRPKLNNGKIFLNDKQLVKEAPQHCRSTFICVLMAIMLSLSINSNFSLIY